MTDNLTRNVQADAKEGLTLVRDITAVDGTPMSLDPGTMDTSANAAISFPVLGASRVGIRIFSNSATGTASIRLKHYPYDGPKPLYATGGDQSTGTVTKGKGGQIFDLTFTTGGSSSVNTHPVTGATVAGVTFYEASSAAVVTAGQVERYSVSPAAGSASHEQIVVVDALGAKWLHPEVYAMTTATRVLVAMWRIDYAG